jgi:hypothetical protein
MHPPKEPTPPEYAARRNAERRAEHRYLWPALLVSALAHAALLLLFTFELDPEPHASGAPPQRLLNIQPAMRAYDIATVAVDAAPIEVQIEERRRAAEPETSATAPGFAVPPVMPEPAEPDPRSEPGARGRLQYRMGSAEVWRPQAPLPLEELSADEIVRRRLAGRIGEYNDSVAGEAAARARATDWTVKGEDGERWGVSPGKVHLGSVTLPLPFELRPSAEVAGRVRSWTEIQQQAARVEGREIFDDRVRAIRERAEQERARKNATTDNGSTGTDGTGSR